MHRAMTLVAVAAMVVSVLAAPMPGKELSRRHVFKANSRGRFSPYRSMRDPATDMARTFQKMGWEIIVMHPSSDYSPLDSIFGPESSSSAPASPESTSYPGVYSVPASSIPAFSVPASSVPYSFPASSAPAATSTAVATGQSEVAATKTAAAAPTSSTSSGDEDDVTGEVEATPEENDSEYLAPVTIGGQKLNMNFDTGSADLWVFSSEMPSSQSRGHSTFNPDQSSSWEAYEGGSWEIAYGDGSTATGIVGFDKVTVGEVTATRQAVELATSVSGSFVSDINNDGLVGLAFSTINTVQPKSQKTFFDNVIDELEQPLFTANLREDTSGSYTFGEIDKSEYKGEIYYTSIDTSSGFWQFDSATYSINGEPNQCSTCSPMIADTGTSLVLVDDDVAEAYYGQVSSAQYDSRQAGYVYDCSEDLPAFGVAIGDSDYTAAINGTQVTYAEIGNNQCFGGVQGNQGGGIQILGAVLLKQHLAVFDGGSNGSPRFGIAEQP